MGQLHWKNYVYVDHGKLQETLKKKWATSWKSNGKTSCKKMASNKSKCHL
jgi:hypothetical protein